MKGYVTLLSNERYLEGVITLNQSLKEVESLYPLYCLLSQSVSQDLESKISSFGIKTIRYDGDSLNTDVINDRRESHNYWSFTLDKLHVWGLTQFNKIVFLDSDMIVLRNLDHLFEKESFSAVVAGARLFGWSKLNSGLLVIEPNKKIEKDLIDLAPKVIKEFQTRKSSVGDQDIIHAYCPRWASRKELCLDEGYNMIADWLDSYIWKFGYGLKGTNKKPMYVIHFIGHTKPWTPKTFREIAWIIKISILNPFYAYFYIKFHRLLRKAKNKQQND